MFALVVLLPYQKPVFRSSLMRCLMRHNGKTEFNSYFQEVRQKCKRSRCDGTDSVTWNKFAEGAAITLNQLQCLHIHMWTNTL